MQGFDDPRAMAESLLAMSRARMERDLARWMREDALPAETLARLHLLQLRRAVREASRA